jgi:hypothetical protein
MIEPKNHKLTEALQRQETNSNRPTDPAGGPQTPTPAEVAENTRREQEAKEPHPPSRDEYLTRVGRGQQTHG